jgi:hypothetical protein
VSCRVITNVYYVQNKCECMHINLPQRYYEEQLIAYVLFSPRRHCKRNCNKFLLLLVQNQSMIIQVLFV